MIRNLSNFALTWFKRIVPTFTIILFHSCEEDKIIIPENKDVGVREVHLIESTHTGFEYQVVVDYIDGFNPEKSYHLYVLLDADYDHDWVCEYLIQNYPDNTILAGVKYADRSTTEYRRVIDFTYPTDHSYASNSGGGNKYLQFVNTELLPLITDELKIKVYKKTIMGTSASAYFALYMTFQQEVESQFNNVIAVSPSLWWANRFIFDAEEEFSTMNRELNMDIYIAMGEHEEVIMKESYEDFSSELTKRNYQGLNLKYEYLPGLNHDNSSSQGYPNGLAFIQQ